MRFLFSILALALTLLSMSDAQNITNNGIGSTPAARHYITANQAQKVIDAAEKSANGLVPQNIAVVDPSGLLVAFLRMDNAYPGSIDISIKKARTSVLFNGITSASLYAGSQPGGPLYGIEETNGGLVVFGGGLPIYQNGKLIGAVGVSGGTVPQDIEVAQAGVDALGAPSYGS